MQRIIYKNDRGQSVALGNSAPFVLTKIEGTGGVKTTLLTSKAPGQDGNSYHGTLLEERPLSITGGIVGNDIEDLYRKRQELSSIFNPKVPSKLIYINDAGTHSIECVVESSPTFKDKIGNIQEFLIQLYCPNPYWMDVNEGKEEIALWVGDFEFGLEIDQNGIEMGHRVSNLICNVFNKGDVECGMRIEFRAVATVVNPSLLNIYTKEYIKVKRNLQAGDKLIIDTNFGSKKIEIVKNNNEKINVFNWIDLRSTFLQLNVGDNVLRYDAEQGIDNLEMSIYYKAFYIGV